MLWNHCHQSHMALNGNLIALCTWGIKKGGGKNFGFILAAGEGMAKWNLSAAEKQKENKFRKKKFQQTFQKFVSEDGRIVLQILF